MFIGPSLTYRSRLERGCYLYSPASSEQIKTMMGFGLAMKRASAEVRIRLTIVNIG